LPRCGERGSIENQTLTQRSPKAVYVADGGVGTAGAATAHWDMEDIALVAFSV
jgi:hypothetical protein